MRESNPKFSPTAASDPAAAGWFIRRERGLSPAEQSDYEKWLSEDPRHEAAIAQLEAVWEMMDPVFAGPAVQDVTPRRDMLAPRTRGHFRVWIPVLAGAAAAALMLWLRPTATSPEPAAPAAGRIVVHPAPERRTLEDGSVVDLNTGAKLSVEFTAAERRVHLMHGEAFFTVAKNPARPFIVDTDRIAVRAVGTAFSVGLGQREVSVVVTEGRVGVNELRPAAGETPASTREISTLGAGQKGVVREAAGKAEMTVTTLTRGQIETLLSWQGLRLEFFDCPLSVVIAEFNRHNRQKLAVADAGTAAMRIGGNFRVDNVDDFVRLLAPLSVSATSHGDEIILQRTTSP